MQIYTHTGAGGVGVFSLHLPGLTALVLATFEGTFVCCVNLFVFSLHYRRCCARAAYSMQQRPVLPGTKTHAILIFSRTVEV